MRQTFVLRKWRMPAIILGVVAVIGWCYAQSADRCMTVGKQEALAIGTDAYIYGYPLVTMEVTRRVMTNFSAAGDRGAPMGQLAVMREYPPASFHEVTAPNADTLYSAAWLDLSSGPYI